MPWPGQGKKDKPDKAGVIIVEDALFAGSTGTSPSPNGGASPGISGRSAAAAIDSPADTSQPPTEAASAKAGYAVTREDIDSIQAGLNTALSAVREHSRLLLEALARIEQLESAESSTATTPAGSPTPLAVSAAWQPVEPEGAHVVPPTGPPAQAPVAAVQSVSAAAGPGTVDLPAEPTAAYFGAVDSVLQASLTRLKALHNTVRARGDNDPATIQLLDKIRELHAKQILIRQASEAGTVALQRSDSASATNSVQRIAELIGDGGGVALYVEREYDSMVCSLVVGLAERIRAGEQDAESMRILAELMAQTGIEDITPDRGDTFDESRHELASYAAGGTRDEIQEVQSPGFLYRGRVVRKPVVRAYSGH